VTQPSRYRSATALTEIKAATQRAGQTPWKVGEGGIMRALAFNICILGGLAVAAGLIAARVATAQPASLGHGHELLRTNCSMCHAVGRTGASPNPASPAFRELGARYPIDDLAEALAEGIIVGHPQMPQFKFSGDDVTDIIAYLKSIQARPPPAN
jgi:mono/diheme cytochrome c family protein